MNDQVHTPTKKAAQGSTIASVFASREQAECAVQRLHEVGINEEQYGIALRQPEDSGESGMSTSEKAKHAGKAAAGGAAAGGIIGALVGAASALLIPGIGPVIAGGMLVSILSGTAAGIAAGGLAGALDGLSIPEDEARFVEQEFQRGNVIVTVQAGPQYDQVLRMLRECGGYDIRTRPVGSESPAINPAHTA